MLVSSSRIPHLGRLLPPQEVREGFPKRLVGCRDVSVPKITGAHRSGRPREGGVTLLQQLRSWKADLRQHPRVSPRWKRRLASRHPSPGVTFLEAPRRQHPTAPPLLPAERDPPLTQIKLGACGSAIKPTLVSYQKKNEPLCRMQGSSGAALAARRPAIGARLRVLVLLQLPASQMPTELGEKDRKQEQTAKERSPLIPASWLREGDTEILSVRSPPASARVPRLLRGKHGAEEQRPRREPGRGLSAWCSCPLGWV